MKTFLEGLIKIILHTFELCMQKHSFQSLQLCSKQLVLVDGLNHFTHLHNCNLYNSYH